MRNGSLQFASQFPAPVGWDDESDVEGGLHLLDNASYVSCDLWECEQGTDGFELVLPDFAIGCTWEAQELNPQLLAFDEPISIPFSDGLDAVPSGLKQTAHWMMVSATLHLALFATMLLLPHAEPVGVGGLGGTPIMVRLVDRENVTAEAPAPASFDSPGSVASLARRVREPLHDEFKNRQEEVKREFPATESVLDDAARPLLTEGHQDKPVPNRRENAERERAREDTITVRSQSLADSTASPPSIASAERRVMTAAGKENRDFKDKVFAAIHETAYYPKEALRQKYHGDVSVAFTLRRDGSLLTVSIAKDSGLPILDEAALNIIRKAAERFPSFPDALTADKVSYVVPIVFKEKPSKGQ